MNTIIARFAPSPTGLLHLGGVRTALINYIIVNQKKKEFPNSKFLLRIEDTDKKRSKNEYVDNIINGLKWMGINWQDEICFQSERLDRHKEIAFELLKNKHAFKCICSSEELEKRRKENLKNNLNIKRICNVCENNEQIQKKKDNFCIRIKIPDEGTIKINDKIQNEVEVKNSEIDNFIILRNDGSPTYMLSVVVDDYDMKVNMIVRGDDHFNNTFRQIHIYNKLNWDIPEYAHLPLIHGSDGSKLSKRHGATDIIELKKIGYMPKAIINNLILLGWSPKKENELIEINEIINSFNINNLSKSSSIFDYKKLDFFNNYYLQDKDGFDYFIKFIKNDLILKNYFIDDENKVKKIFLAYKSKIKKFNEFKNILNVFFNKNFKSNNDDILKNELKNTLHKFLNKLKSLNNWNENDIQDCIKNFISQENIKIPEFAKPVRHILTNDKDGISLHLIIYILGIELTNKRLNNYINN